jgi:hypothetical protein
MQKANAAFAAFRLMAGAAGVSGAVAGDTISYDFDGTGDALTMPDSADWDFMGSSSGSRSIDFWIKAGTLTGSDMMVCHSESIGPNHHWIFQVSTTAMDFFAQSGGATLNATNTTVGIADTDWHHVLLVRVADEFAIYIDGAQEAYTQESSTDTYAGKLGIGIRDADAAGTIDALFDEIRFYTGNPFSAAPVVGETDTITVPTSQHTSDANTTLLIHCGETKTGTTGSNATFTDSGNTGHTVTEVGDAIENTVTYKW